MSTLTSSQLQCATHGGYIEAERFDSRFFSISSAELLLMDPQQRLLLERGVRAALNGWIEHTELLATQRRRLRSAASAFRGDGLRLGWNQWATSAHANGQRRRLASRAAARLMLAPLARAWATWQGAADERARFISIANRAALMMLDARGRAWNQWVGLMDGWYRLRIRVLVLRKNSGLTEIYLRFLCAHIFTHSALVAINRPLITMHD